MNRYALRDDHWDRIKDLLPGKPGDVGVAADDNRRLVEAVLYRYRTGIPWRDLPERLGDWKNTHERFSRGAIKGTSRNAGGRGDAGGWAECLKRSGENGREDSKQPSSRRSGPRCVFQPTGSDCQPIGYRGRISTAAHFGAGCRRWRDRPSSSSRGVHGHRIRYRRLWSDRVQGWHRLP